jgi:modulator of FtsH protease HflC
MSRFLWVGIAAAAVFLLFVANRTFFILDPASQALVQQFGRNIDTITEPGLHTLNPLYFQNAIIYSKQVLDFEPPPLEVTASDQKRLVVDSFVRYRIAEPLKFYQSVGTEEAMRLRLGVVLNGALRRVIGNIVLARLLSPERGQIMGLIKDDVATEAKSFGLEVIDVRIRRADLPRENSQAIYQRMQSERDRQAKEYRAEGAEAAAGIRARADKEVTVIRADANKKAQILRGEGDAESTKLYADAYNQDPEFFNFYRSLQAYGEAFNGNETTMVLSPDSEFFRYLSGRKGMMGTKPTGP